VNAFVRANARAEKQLGGFVEPLLAIPTPHGAADAAGWP
jgi:hypothetical protein